MSQPTDSQLRELQALLDSHEAQIAGARKTIEKAEASKVHPHSAEAVMSADALIARAQALIAEQTPIVASLRATLGLSDEGQADA